MNYFFAFAIGLPFAVAVIKLAFDYFHNLCGSCCIGCGICGELVAIVRTAGYS